MSESFDKAVEAAARELFESEENTAMVAYPEWDSPKNIGKPLYIEDARAAVTAALPHLTAQDVPHVAREAWDEGYDRALRSHCDALDLDGRCDVEDPNPYAEEVDHE